jgi:hypothetical protein
MGVLWELELQIFEGRARKVMGACFYFFTWKWKVLFLSLHIYAHVLQIFSVLKTTFFACIGISLPFSSCLVYTSGKS